MGACVSFDSALEVRVVGCLSRCALFSGISDIELKKLVPLFHEVYFDSNTCIFKQGAIADKLYFVVNGDDEVLLSVRNPKGTRDLVLKTAGDWFGDDSTWYMSRDGPKKKLQLPNVSTAIEKIRYGLFMAQATMHRKGENYQEIKAANESASESDELYPRYSVSAVTRTPVTCICIDACGLSSLYFQGNEQLKINLDAICAENVMKKFVEIDFMVDVPITSLNLLRSFCKYEWKNDSEIICNQGDVASELYVLLHGSAVAHLDLKETPFAYITNSYFGEMGLFLNLPRTVTITACFEQGSKHFKQPKRMSVVEVKESASKSQQELNEIAKFSTILLVLQNVDISSFFTQENQSDILEAASKQRIATYFKSFKIPFFMALSDSQLKMLIEISEMVNFDANSVIFKQGEIGEAFFLVVFGRVRVTREIDNKEHILEDLGPGRYFGEVSLIKAQPRSATITTITRTILLKLNKFEFDAFFENAKEAVADLYVTFAREDVELKHLVTHPAGLESFSAFAKSEYSDENVSFWKQARSHNDWAYQKRKDILYPLLPKAPIKRASLFCAPASGYSASFAITSDKPVKSNMVLRSSVIVADISKVNVSLSDESKNEVKQFVNELFQRCVILRDTYIAENSPKEVNIRWEIRKKINLTVESAMNRLKSITDFLDATRDPSMFDHGDLIYSVKDIDDICGNLCGVFNEAEKEILHLMTNDSYTRYKKSEMFRKFLADTSPYEPSKREFSVSSSISGKSKLPSLDIDKATIRFSPKFHHKSLTGNL